MGGVGVGKFSQVNTKDHGLPRDGPDNTTWPDTTGPKVKHSCQG